MNKFVNRLFLLALLVCANVEAQTVEYIHTDALGTPVAVTNATGQVLEHSEYEPYGAVVNRPVKDGPGYTGHVEDAATGLTYMQQRYYDPSIGRFLSVDPVAAREKGDNFNRYWYANSNPYRFTDPDGRESSVIRAMERDNVAYLSGNMSSADLAANREARGLGALAGASVVGTVLAAPTVITAVLANPGAIATATDVAAGAAGVTGAAAGIGGVGRATGLTAHAVDQAITRGVKPANILDAVKNPLKTTAIKFDSRGRPSYKAIGERATVAINPETKKIVTVHPTSTRVAEKLKAVQ